MLLKLKYITLLLIIGVNTVCAQRVVFAPQWSAQAQFAGYYVAQAKGYYQSTGLETQIIHPSQSENAYSLLESGKAQIITLNLNQALHYISQGADLVNVMQTSQVNSQLLVGHIPLTNLASLGNRKLGVLSYIDFKLVQLITSKYGVKAQFVRYNGGVNVFLSKAVDACLMVSYNEFIQLAECGYRADSTHVMRLSDWGYDMPEDGVYVLRSYYEQNRETVRKFVEASKKGWDYTANHEKEALGVTMTHVKESRIATNEYHQGQMLREVLRLQKSPDTGERNYRLTEKSFESALSFIEPGMLKYSDFVK